MSTQLIQSAGAALPEEFFEVGALARRGDALRGEENPDRLRALLHPQSPFAESREVAAFVIPGAARATATFDPRLVVEGGCVAVFGHWESMGNADAEHAVLSAVATWARDRGARRLYGPVDLTTALNYRFPVWREETATLFAGEPDQPLRHGESMRGLGLEVAGAYVTQVLAPEGLRAFVARAEPAYLRLRRDGYRFEALDFTVLQRRSDEFFALINSAFRANFGFVPLSRREFELLQATVLSRLSGEASVLVYSPEGELVGCMLCYVNSVPTSGASNGSASRLVIKTAFVAEAHRKSGMTTAASYMAAKSQTGSNGGACIALMHVNNPSRRVFREFMWERTYALFSRSLES